MSLARRLVRFSVVAGLLSPLIALPLAQGQAPGTSIDPAAEEARQAQIAERFFGLLERTPRRGTALDRVYGYHVEFGTLEKFIGQLKERVKNRPDDSAAWMILGLIDAHRGQDASAVDAFRQAEKYRLKDALAPYYLGQSLLLVGRPEEAVQAFERAIERQPDRADLLEIFQQLGRVHQRAQHEDEARKIWVRLEQLFPDDPRVLEQIAVTLVEEGKYDQALPRYERLISLVRDDYRKSVFRIQVAEAKIRQNRRPEGVADFEALLADLNPDGWLHRDVRRRVEDVFLRSGDQDGLVGYYEKWLSAHPQDVDAMARVAKFLAGAARVPEARNWLEQALKLAPSRAELRRTFIEQLAADQQYAEAARQYALLSQASPGNTDVLRDWGRLVLKDKTQAEENRKKEAARIWNGIVSARANDALTAAQTADLFRHAGMQDEALALYRKAVELAPEDPQYREYLGEFHHIQKQSEQALEVWRQIAQAARRTAPNLARLAEVLNSFGYSAEAAERIAEAARLDAKDLALQLKAADFHGRVDQHGKALEYVAAAARLAANDEERELVLKQRIETLQASRTLEDETERLAAQLAMNPTAADDWHTLARYYEADRKWTQAAEAVARTLERQPESVPALSTAARIAELSGDFSTAASLFRRLAAADRRSRGEHLTNVARLESQLGHTDAALEAGRDLIVSAPGNTAHYEFYAQLCFQLGRADEGLETLRKAVRINPTDPHLMTALASALAGQFKTDEAIQVYWQAFEKSETLEDQVGLVTKLTDLHVQLNQFDRLIERLARERRNEDKRRLMTICLAQAHHSSGDYGSARSELESLLNQDTRDSELLQQLSKLCEEGRDVTAAVDYQKQLVAIAPSHETEFRLAALLQASGEAEAANEIFMRLTRREEDPGRLLRSLDSLYTSSGMESLIAVTEPLLQERRDDWELLYREGAAWAALDKSAEARDRFRRILSINLPYDSLGVRAQENLKQQQARARSNNLLGIQSAMPTRPSPLNAVNEQYQVRQAVGLDRDYYGYSGQAPRLWAPDSFAVARMAAYAWLMKFAEGTSEQDAVIDDVVKAAARDTASREALLDALYVETLRYRYASVFDIARRLARRGGIEEQSYFLNALPSRSQPDPRARTSSRDQQPQRTPLSDDDIDLMMKCFEAVRQQTASPLGTSAARAARQNLPQYAGAYGVAANWAGLNQVVAELKLAGRQEQAEALEAQQLAASKSSYELLSAMQLQFDDKNPGRVMDLLPRWKEAALDELAKQPAGPAGRGVGGFSIPLSQASYQIAQWMGALAGEQRNDAVLSIYDQAAEVGIAEARRRRSQKRPGSSVRGQTGQTGPMGFTMRHGTQNFHVQIDFPRANEHIDSGLILLLRQAFESFNRNDVSSDLTAHVRKQSETASPDDRLYYQLLYGYLLWWQENRDDAIQVITRAAELLPDDPEFRLDLASLHEARGQFDEALALVDSLVPRDQKLLQSREIMAMQLAERVGDIARARSAAERLFGLRLDSSTQLALAAHMRRLGLHEMAEAVSSRVQRRSGEQSSDLVALMVQYQAQGKTELVQQLAHTLLRRSTGAPTAMGGRRVMQQGNDSEARQQALRMLLQTGGLKPLVERLEGQLANSPNSPRLYEQLIEYYGVLNNREKVQELLEKAIERRPEAPELRLQMAKHLESTGKVKEACDQYIVLIKSKPELLYNDFWQVQNLFQRAQREADLAKVLGETNLKAFRNQPYYIIEVASNLMRNEKTRDVGLDLFERCFKEFPSYRNQLISNIYDAAVWKLPRVFEIGKTALIPGDGDIATQPWFGLGQINSYSSGGTVNSSFHQMLQALKGSEKEAELRQAIAKRLEEAPQWHGGVAMLAIIDVKAGRKNEGIAALEKLLADKAALDTLTADGCWMIGQELDQIEQSRALAMTLFNRALQAPQSMNQVQYSPVARLVKLHADLGERDRAREVLLKAMKSSNDGYDAAYQSYVDTSNWLFIAGELKKLEFPVDAIRVYQRLVNQPQRVEQAAMFYGGSRGQGMIEQARAGMNSAISSLSEKNAEQAVVQLLSPVENRTPSDAVLDLLLVVPDQKQAATQPLQSSLVQLLESASGAPSVQAEIQKRLQGLARENPDDISVAISSALLSIKRKTADSPQQIAGALALIRRVPLDELPDNRRPNSRERASAARSIPLWLLARECLRDPKTREAGSEFARRALEGATRQVNRDAAVAILYEWGKLALEIGDRAEAERRWSQLLEFVTARPQKEAPPPPRDQRGAAVPQQPAAVPVRLVSYAAPAPGEAVAPKPAEKVPPLTISQFRLAIEIAKTAAENGFAGLSRRALRESLTGGMPVPDVSDSRQFGSGSGGAVSVFRARGGPTSLSSPAEAGEEVMQEVAGALRQILTLWESGDYPAGEVYDILTPIVFPANRAAEILLYADSSRLAQAEVASLGAALVDWARRARRVDDLARQVQARKANPTAKVAALVLEIRLALAGGDAAAVKTGLEELDKALQAGAAPAHVELAAHAALPAFENAELQAAAYPVLKRVLQQQAQSDNQGRSSGAGLGILAGKLNRYLARSGDTAAVRQFYDQYMAGRQQLYAQYSGDSGLRVQLIDWAKVAEDAAGLGASAVALEYMGRVIDMQMSRATPPTLAPALAGVVRDLSVLPARQRYEIWRDWTLPQPARRTVRFTTEVIEPLALPDGFLLLRSRPAGDDLRALRTDLLSNIYLLLDAADEAGALPELRDLAKAAFEEKISDADLLWTLVLMRAGDVEEVRPLVTKHLSTVDQRHKDNNLIIPQGRAFRDYLLWRRCIEHPVFAPIAIEHQVKMFTNAKGSALTSVLTRMILDQARQQRRAEARPETPAPVQFAHWFPATTRLVPANGIDPWWSVWEGRLVHLAGPGADMLYFKYPLTGEFEFSVDAFSGQWAEANTGYGGAVVEPLNRQMTTTNISSVSGHDIVRRPDPLERSEFAYNRLRVQSHAGQARFLVNEHEVHAEPAGLASPWLQISVIADRTASLHNLRFTGNPEIPREVPLFAGERLDGWSGTFFSETLPRKRLMAEKPPENENDAVFYDRSREPATFDWQVRSGVLSGLRKPQARPDAQSWLYYHRPLLADESVRYEFFYVPGQVEAHPALGRLAFLLHPEGVRTHWIARPGWDENVVGIPADNSIAEVAHRRLGGPLPLKANDWNSVRVAIENDAAAVWLNGVEIFRRPLERDNSRCFGLFRYAPTECRVRSAYMTGPWPEKLTDDVRGSLLALVSPPPAEDRPIYNRILGNRLSAKMVREIVARARHLPDDKAYALLRDWVLPSADHADFRLFFEGHVSDFAVADSDMARTFADGELVCAARELVTVAKRLGRLDELSAATSAVPPSNKQAKSGRLGMLLLVAIAREDDVAAAEHLKGLYALVRDAPPEPFIYFDRASEYTAVWAASRRPALQRAADDFARMLAENVLGKDKDSGQGLPEWRQMIFALAGETQARRAAFPSATASLSQWKAVPYWRIETKGRGFFHSRWDYERGHLRSVPGEVAGQLVFQSPLRGKFEIVAERFSRPQQELTLTYGVRSAASGRSAQTAAAAAPAAARAGAARQPATPTPQAPEPPGEPAVGEYRVVVDGQKVVTWIDGKKTDEQAHSSRPDPWLVIQPREPGYACALRNVRIMGQPEIPDRLDLVNTGQCADWRADYYGETFTINEIDETALWKRQGEEIVARLRTDRAAKMMQSLLLYQRPMLEDGEITFETYYRPGEFEVHPALGRAAFLLRPSGVRLHVLTDAQYETSDLKPENESPIAGAAATVPLKENDWNRIRLELKGDRARVFVNDVEVAGQTIAVPAEMRFFGLFRYSDQTKCRVRNIVYRGDWPRTLPALAEQQLAYAPAGPVVLADAPPLDRQVIALAQPLSELARSGIAPLGPPDRIKNTESGLKLALDSNADVAAGPGIELKKSVAGDCEATLDLTFNKLTPGANGERGASGVTFTVNLDDAVGTAAELAAEVRPGGQRTWRVAASHRLPDGQQKADSFVIPRGGESVRLRVIRKGTRVYCLAAEGPDGEFRLIDVQDVGTAPIRGFSVRATTGDPSAAVEAVARALTLRVRPAAPTVSRAGARPVLMSAASDDSHSSAAPVYLALADQDAAPPKAAEKVPPLTITQFRLAMEVARTAAENGFPALSLKALRDALTAGAPVPDASDSRQIGVGTGGIQQRAVAGIAGGLSNPGETGNEILVEVAGSLRQILSLWEMGDYPATEVYDILTPFVFPANRPGEIQLYADSSRLSQGEVSSLGAALVDWARRAKRTGDLARQIETRKGQPLAKVAALVLETRIALAAGDSAAVKSGLENLDKALQAGAVPAHIELAAHAALPAFEKPDLQAAAYPVLKRAVQQQAQSEAAQIRRVPAGSGGAGLGVLAGKLNRYLASSGNIEAVRQFYDQYLAARQPSYARYGGDAGLALQVADWARVAEDAAGLGATTVALEYLGRAADVQLVRNQPSVATAFAAVVRDLSALPPQKRYETWRDWTMPREGRQSVRSIFEVVEPVQVPAVFLRQRPAGEDLGRLRIDDILSNLLLLVDEAKDAGALPELRALAKAAFEQQLPNADLLWAFLTMRTGEVAEAAPIFESLLSTVDSRYRATNPGPPTIPLVRDSLIWRACLQNDELAPIAAANYDKFVRLLISGIQPLVLPRISVDLARQHRRVHGRSEAAPDPGLVHWFPVLARGVPTDGIEPWWSVVEDRVAHFAGPGWDTLMLKYPLTGNFEFSAQAFCNFAAEGNAGYGGLIVESLHRRIKTSIWPVSGHEVLNRGDPLERIEAWFNRIRIQSADGRMKFFLNDHLVYEEELSGTSPWVQLCAERDRITCWYDLKIDGDPQIPREVALLSGERMDGWNSSFFSETQPRKRLLAEPAGDPNESPVMADRAREPAVYDWSTKQGMLTGARKPQAAADSQSWLYYHRPLLAGESVRYEFFYTPGRAEVQPAVGRLAFLLHPDGVRTHWIARPGWDESALGIGASNVIDEPECRRGTAPLPLKANDWNTVRVTLENDCAVVQLNDAEVFRRPLELENSRCFGLFRSASHEARVRAVSLSGPWPERITPEIRKNLLATSAPGLADERKLQNRLLGTRLSARVVRDVVARARRLPDAEAYVMLRNWVLPSDDHTDIRLFYDKSPSEPADSDSELSRKLAPGELVAAAWDLVRLAGRLGRLDELASLVPAALPDDRRFGLSRDAMVVLIDVERKRDDAARAGLASIYQTLKNGPEEFIPPYDRAAEFLAVWVAAQRPALERTANDVAVMMYEQAQLRPTGDGAAEWLRMTQQLAGETRQKLAAAQPARAAAGRQSQWRAVNPSRADARGRGFRTSRWALEAGLASHFPGDVGSQLFFQSPLRGKFEILAERSIGDLQEMSLVYGGAGARAAVAPGPRAVAPPNDPETPKPPALANMRLTIDGPKVTTFTDGAKTSEAVLGPRPDPWLMLQGKDSGFLGSVRNVRIVGQPEIPDRLDLVNTGQCADWRADYYGETFTVNEADETALWKRQGEEIVARLRTDRAAKMMQSLLLYQRPMLEDGEITFETYYRPGEFEVHPALGRAAFLLRPTGVRLHVLTDAQYETSDLKPENESPLAGAAATVPLKENDWNRIRLELKGDRAKVFVNDVEVAGQTIAVPAEMRFFGLFRYSDQTKCRVRNIVYRGDWPRTLPALAEQQLAYAPGGPVVQLAGRAQQQVTSLTGSLADLAKQGIGAYGASDRVSAGPRGLKLDLRSSIGERSWPGIEFKKPAQGDFDVTLALEGVKFRLGPANESWGGSVVFSVELDDPAATRSELATEIKSEGPRFWRASAIHLLPDGKRRNEAIAVAGGNEAVRLRLIRKGSRLYCLAAAGSSDEFKLIDVHDVGAAPVRRFTVQARAIDAEATVEAIARSLTLLTGSAENAGSR